MHENSNWISLLSSKLKSCEKISKFASNTLNHFQSDSNMLYKSSVEEALTGFASMIEVYWERKSHDKYLGTFRK